MTHKLIPHQRSDIAAKQILQDLLLILQNNTQPVIDDIDTEFLHHFRIAVRRTRVLLSQLPGIFPTRPTKQFINRFKELGAMTTQLRDLDVLLEEFTDYEAIICASKDHDLDAFKAYIEQQRHHQLNYLKHYLRSRSYEKFINRWQLFLGTPCPENSRLPNAILPIDEFLGKRTWRSYRRVLRDGTRITDQSASAELHALRKNSKKLRYLIEFGQSLHSKKKVRKAIKIMKRLQNILGKFQDLSVHLYYLKDVQAQMAEEKILSEENNKAIKAIINKLKQQQQHCRGNFHKAFTEFSSETNQVFFTALFKKQ